MKKIFLLFIVAISVIKTNSQNLEPQGMNPLFAFLKNTFDSSVVFYADIPRKYMPNYYIIAHLNNRAFLFTYANPYDIIYGKGFPNALKLLFLERQTEYILTNPDTNRYFLPKRIDDLKAENFWKEINEKNVWNFKNDSLSFYPCKDTNGLEHQVYDDYTQYFITLTKSSTNSAFFYAPFFYDEHCPGNINRKQAIAIMRLFRKIFGE